MVDKTYMTWDMFDKTTKGFVKYINALNLGSSCVLGIKRGGLPPATMISNHCGIPISLVTYQTRDGEDTVPVFLEPRIIENSDTIILIDDILDSGKTIANIVSQLRNSFPHKELIGIFYYANKETYSALSMTIKIDKWNVDKISNGEWIVFPWEDDN